MKLTREQVEHIAKLARIELSEEEKDLYSRQLSSILEYMEILQEVDTSSTAPTSQVTGLENIRREDEVIQTPPEVRVALLSQAPERCGESIRVKGVFGGA